MERDRKTPGRPGGTSAVSPRIPSRRDGARRSTREMSEEVIIIVPELREGAGGLADYTLRLTEQWRTVAPVRFLVPSSADFSTGAGQSVEEIGRSAEELREKLPARGGKVLLQYSAYGFDSHGYPRWLLRTLTDWKERAAGLLVVMFHEIWGLWPLLNTNYLLQR